jgi:HK97 family phage prohead protease
MDALQTISGTLTTYGKANDHRQYFVKGSFEQWLSKEPVVKMLFEHRENIVVGEAKGFCCSGHGLRFNEGVLFDTPAGRDMKRLIDVDVISSISLYYLYGTSSNPEPEYGGLREIKTVNNVSEISLVISPADPGAQLDGKGQREKDIESYYKRMDNYFKVKNQLECEEIKTIVHNKWEEVYSAYLESLSINN